VLTVYGIETGYIAPEDNTFKVATVLTVYGIETPFESSLRKPCATVATVLTVYGIETH